MHPHGYCYLWDPALVTVHVTSDALIGLSYVSISLTLGYMVVRSRRHIPFSWMFLAFGAFIIACAATHFMEIWTLWWPSFWPAANVKVVTALASVITAVTLPPLVPKVLALVESARVSEQRASDLNAANQELDTLAALRKSEADRADLLVREREARTEAEEANRLKDQFLATLSHELRTPLNAILGYARMLRTNAIPAAKRDRAIEIIERNALAQNQLVEDLLDISRITTGNVRLDTQPLRMADPLQDALENIRPAAEAKHITIELDIDPLAGVVNADAARLQQVFWNLLTNAVKFSLDGGRVSVTLEQGQGAIRTTISNSGIGIAPAFLPYVFDMFRQADGGFTRQYGGLGLGLAITRQLVDLHGGTITAASDGPGCGATFTVVVPEYLSSSRRLTDQPRRTGSPLVAPLRTADESGAALQGLDILVVDDETDALELFRSLLESAGATVRTVPGGREALTAFDRRRPDLLVTDLGLPGMDGYDVLRQVRARPQDDGRDVPAVAVTAYARMYDRTKSLAAGFNAHIAKPIDPTTFVGVLIAVVKHSRPSV